MRWTLKPKPDELAVKTLSKSLGVSDTIAELLVQRDIKSYDEAKAFFRPKLAQLHDPFLMKDMDKAIQRIEQALKTNESILVFGDYDVDGTTAVALVYSFLKTLNAPVDYYIPDRYAEGYGVSYQGIDFAYEHNHSLIIALDCGIKALEHVNYAKAKGIDFIICDHHLPGNELPNAIAVLDPKRQDCNYPYKELCGCGIGFKLIQAVTINRNKDLNEILCYLDLVATAIAADIVPITGENRILAAHGLKQINSSPRLGFKVIINSTKKEVLTITDLVFVIAPRINAAGRMKHGKEAVKLLVETDDNAAIEQAKLIEHLNADRKNEDQRITEAALDQIKAHNETDNYTTVVYNSQWHKGVIGIVASRLIETYYRPTLVFTKSGEHYVASARSVKGFDVYKALEACSAYLIQFGGHKYAAGLSMQPDKYLDFKQAFENYVKATISEDLLTAQLSLDTQINFEDITPKLYRVLKQFQPFGPGNMSPVFLTKNVTDAGSKAVGNENLHLKLAVSQANNTFQGIGFNMGDSLPIIKQNKLFDLSYSIDENHWNNKTTLQLKVKGIKT